MVIYEVQFPIKYNVLWLFGCNAFVIGREVSEHKHLAGRGYWASPYIFAS